VALDDPRIAEAGPSADDDAIETALAEHFAPFPDARPLFDAVRVAIGRIGHASLRVGRSQVSFRRSVAFAWVWVPGRYLRGAAAPLVLSVALPVRDGSLRWKQVLEPAPGRWMHHLELRSVAEIDEEVAAWLRRAWEAAGRD